jgi:hypothetical protein
MALVGHATPPVDTRAIPRDLPASYFLTACKAISTWAPHFK